MATTPKDKDRVKDLEGRLAAALDAIERLSQANAAMAGQVGVSRPVMTGQLVVGIRNVSNYGVGLVDTTTGQRIEYNLNPEVAGSPDPHTRAVISYAFWQQLRQSPTYAKGLVIRDDSILGPADNVAPPDREQDLHPDGAKNQVLVPRAFIADQPEEVLRERIAAMTSEPSLRRLIEAVDAEVQAIADKKYLTDPDRAKKAMRDLPAVFRVVEELCFERLDELNPASGDKEDRPERVQRLRAMA